MLDEWIAAVEKELGLSVPVDVPLLLDVARVAAHEVERVAAPLTTFLVGYALAAGQAGQDGLPEMVRRIEALADGWAARAGDAPAGSPE